MTTMTRTLATEAAAKFAAMTNVEFLDYYEPFEYDEGPTCPHCDATFPHTMANNWCWCAGCDACDRARAGVIRYTAETAAWRAEHDLRWPPAPPAPVLTGALAYDDEPF